MLNPYKKFKIELSSEISISEDLKTVNLGISYRGYIKKIERSLKDTLKLHGFNVRENNSNNLSISLANLSYISKDSKRKALDAQIIPQNKIENKTLKINKFQLWKKFIFLEVKKKKQCKGLYYNLKIQRITT